MTLILESGRPRMTDIELKEKMEERQMCEEAPGVINTAIMIITNICVFFHV